MLFTKEDVDKARRSYRENKQQWLNARYKKNYVDCAETRLIEQCKEVSRLIDEIKRRKCNMYGIAIFWNKDWNFQRKSEGGLEK